eukprot:g15845.t1
MYGVWGRLVLAHLFFQRIGFLWAADSVLSPDQGPDLLLVRGSLLASHHLHEEDEEDGSHGSEGGSSAASGGESVRGTSSDFLYLGEGEGESRGEKSTTSLLKKKKMKHRMRKQQDGAKIRTSGSATVGGGGRLGGPAPAEEAQETEADEAPPPAAAKSKKGSSAEFRTKVIMLVALLFVVLAAVLCAALTMPANVEDDSLYDDNQAAQQGRAQGHPGQPDHLAEELLDLHPRQDQEPEHDEHKHKQNIKGIMTTPIRRARGCK